MEIYQHAYYYPIQGDRSLNRSAKKNAQKNAFLCAVVRLEQDSALHVCSNRTREGVALKVRKIIYKPENLFLLLCPLRIASKTLHKRTGEMMQIHFLQPDWKKGRKIPRIIKSFESKQNINSVKQMLKKSRKLRSVTTL